MIDTPRSCKRAFRQGITDRQKKPSRQTALDEDAQKIQDDIKSMMANMNSQTVPPPLPISPDSGHKNFNRTMVYLNSLVGKCNSLEDNFFMDFTDITNATLSEIRKKQRSFEQRLAQQIIPEQQQEPAPTTCVRFKDGSIGFRQGLLITKCAYEQTPIYDEDAGEQLVDVTDTSIAMDLRQMPEDAQIAKAQAILDGTVNYSTVNFTPGLQVPYTVPKHNSQYVQDTEQTQVQMGHQ